MRFHARCLAAVSLFLLCLSPGRLSGQSQSHLTVEPPNRASWSQMPKYKADEILVRFRPNTSSEKMNSLLRTVHAQSMKSWASVPGLQLLRLPAGTNIRNVIQAYKQS